MDFESEHGTDTTSFLLNNWSLFFERKLTVLVGLLNDPERRKALTKAKHITGIKHKI